MSTKRKMKKRRPKKPVAETVDRHVLYEQAVQDVDFDRYFLTRVYRKVRGRPFRRLREDFCGTAALATAWASAHRENRAWGVDLHEPTLDWGRRHHLARRGQAAKRVALVHDNVLTAKLPKVDVTVAFNFSYWVFKTRPLMVRYFRTAFNGLKANGLFFLDAFGGQQAMAQLKDRRRIHKATRPDKIKVPNFTYVWDQARFNAINHEIRCHIHFRFEDGSRLFKAFTYDWRLWTLPELQEMLLEAGFKRVDVYLHGWDEDGESDEIYRRRTFYENQLAWVGYLVAVK